MTRSTLSRSVAVLALLVAGARANAQTINFDDLIGRNNFFDAGIAATYHGYHWGTSLYGIQSGQTGWAYGSNGSILGNGEDPAPSSAPTIGWTWNGGQSLFIDFLAPTSLASADFANLFPDGQGSNASTIEMIGYDGAGNVVATSSVMNLTHTMQTLDAGFTGINAVEFRSDASGAWFTVDDIVLGQVQAAPEPASFVLLGTGLLGIGAVVRRRRSA